ncbi:uncharacterized protein LOC111711067 [Eurytemora carolleeae]|uniref:uncharacterized protein LOC111711067 n=1 Tax=Eurytemora carolleeae TaxID=1294199 RepID=UPI000C7609D0|nr:uncharacterized protein LOC111711067 [Eurytemora carolleeae]|eukprot:XP_023341082.1 uncharacterized protein LOC111711067 [Eurytemora affinis]
MEEGWTGDGEDGDPLEGRSGNDEVSGEEVESAQEGSVEDKEVELTVVGVVGVINLLFLGFLSYFFFDLQVVIDTINGPVSFSARNLLHILVLASIILNFVSALVAGCKFLYKKLRSPRGSSDAEKGVQGVLKCGRDNCVTCEGLVEGCVFKSSITHTKYSFKPQDPCNCRSRRVIYLVTCQECHMQYVGKTERGLYERHYEHRKEVNNESSPLGRHFGKCGEKNWSIQIIEKCSSSDALSKREGHWIKELRCLSPDGINIRDEGKEGLNLNPTTRRP